MTGALGSIGSPGETEKLSSPFTIDALLARWEGAALTRKDASHYLDMMCTDATCRMATALNGKYLLQLGEIGACVKQLMLEAAVRDKFGELACRIFRMLLRKKGGGGGADRAPLKLELKQLAELALLPEREARPLLMKLLQSDYVLLQELPRTVDHNPRTTTYLWHVDLDAAYRTLERSMFLSVANLFSRMAHERSAHALALATVPQPGAPLAPTPEQLSEAQQAEARLAQRKLDCLENSILLVHQAAMKMRII